MGYADARLKCDVCVFACCVCVVSVCICMCCMSVCKRERVESERERERKQERESERDIDPDCCRIWQKAGAVYWDRGLHPLQQVCSLRLQTEATGGLSIELRAGIFNCLYKK